ncbi:hypothetical protein DUNSADRAFT_9691 [Dunaliella salina]|uniref:ubiquitinyl hydrolase 1 n=1 Tax=Dunaliella salina TaxID=3046 RepID=A0ABQ7GGX4_DUNSA|nr:hypothetical protein DUNSADRAFT_9691 [Dunaliella salina]|eukprot:KAF5833854.1 hypothetical protein DUNSADRAFT_9691 [Dunaliella salina]
MQHVDETLFEASLHSVFRLPHIRACTNQQHASCLHLSHLFKEFTSALQQEGECATERSILDSSWQQLSASSKLWPGLSADDLQALCNTVDVVSSPDFVEWLPSFGCAVLALGQLPPGHGGEMDFRPCLGEVSIFVVGLDNFEFAPHSTRSTVDHTAQSSSHSMLYSGSVAARKFRDLVSVLHMLVAKRKAEAKEKKGFHRTPSLIHAALQDALVVLNSEDDAAMDDLPATMPRGGFTDVVLEQTGICALTSPSTQSDPSSLHLLCMAHFELWLLSLQAHRVSPPTCTPVALNSCMTMLQSAAGKAADLAADGHGMQSFEAACHRVGHHLADMWAAQAHALAQQFELPPRGGSLSAEQAGYHFPQGAIPSLPHPVSDSGGLPAAQSRARENLGSLPQLPVGVSFQGMLAWLELRDWEEQQSVNGVAAMLRLHSVERELFSRAASRFTSPPLRQEEVTALEKVVDRYREIHMDFMASPVSKACMQTEWQSRLLLVVWVSYCLLHVSACSAHPLAASYGVCLQWTDLKHLVLSDKAAVDAALGVSAYLLEHSKPGKDLFSLRDDKRAGTATFDLALQYAKSDGGMLGIMEGHRQDADKRTEAHWQEVLRKKAKLDDLRQQKSTADTQLSSLRTQLSSAQIVLGVYSCSSKHSSRYQSCAKNVNRIQGDVFSAQITCSDLQNSIDETGKAPPPVIQPLPQNQSSALVWIFCMHMPSLLRQLSRASFLAQQLLLPTPEHAKNMDISTPEFPTNLLNHYNQYQQPSQYLTTPHVSSGCGGHVLLLSCSRVPQTYGPGHVDNFNYRGQGVWYPDSLPPNLAWRGSGCPADQAQHIPMCHFNPFGYIPDLSLVLTYTEQLPASAEMLQWAMPLPERVSPDRGNLGIAFIDQRPTWLSEPGFRDFGSLRAYPHVQLRRLCSTLHERTLPLSHPAVCVLIRQWLFHLGALTTNCSTHIRNNNGKGDVLTTLGRELTSLAAELDEAPREHQAVILLGEVAAYLADWNPTCWRAALKFASMTSRAADSMDQPMADAAGDEELQQNLLARQCELRMLALLCFSAGPLSTEGAASMLRLMVLIRHGHVFLDSPATRERLSSLHIRCHEVMCRRAAPLTSHALHSPQILTAAVASVLQRTPPHLEWQQLSESGSWTGSFEAVSKDGHLFSINTVDGTVLYDGCPPSRIPKAILNHRMYKRCFGDNNFEVATSAEGVLQTIKPVKGAFYDFYAVGDKLVAIEVDAVTGVRLELLDVGIDAACSPWGGELPIRLRKMHSHWICRSLNAILLRPIAFQDRHVHFLTQLKPAPAAPAAAAAAADRGAQLDSSGSSSSSERQVYTCWRIPPHLQALPWLQLLHERQAELTDCLILPGTSYICSVLSKMEPLQYIHSYISRQEENCVVKGLSLAEQQQQQQWQQQQWQQQQHQQQQKTILFELPRFGCEFMLHGGELHSMDFRDYVLKQQQQLVAEESGTQRRLYTLPGLQQYLVLQKGHSSSAIGAHRADTLVLIPSGHVSLDESSSACGGRGAAGPVTVHLPDSCSSKLQVHSYEVHGRFGDLRAPSIVARLQLAALYAATSTLLPEPASRCCGTHMAMQLLRQCWKNHPLSYEEAAQLQSLASLGRHAPGLRLLAHELLLSTSQLSHLYADASGSSTTSTPPPLLDPDASICYLKAAQPHKTIGWRGFRPNPRALLNALEEQRVLGIHPKPTPLPFWVKEMRRVGKGQLHAPPCPVPAEFVVSTEAQLSSLVHHSSSQAVPPYPLSSSNSSGSRNSSSSSSGGRGNSAKRVKLKHDDSSKGPDSETQSEGLPLERAMHRELQASWEAHHSLPSAYDVDMSAESLQAHIREIQAGVELQRKQVESYLMHNIEDVPEGTGMYGSCFRLLRACGAAPFPGLLDFARSAIQPSSSLLSFNPFLTPASCDRLVEGARVWMQLCVLEDRLRRILELAHAGEEFKPLLIQELQCERTWSVACHPEWLVLEVEGQLQIRPTQYCVAEHLLQNPGAVDQLNMGEGKTRVILPMLATTWANGQGVVRLNFLSTLLDEAYGYLHSFLTASVLNRKLFRQPFHRDVEVTVESAAAMRANLAFCQQVGGLLLVAPEHRLSLELKRDELFSHDHAVCAEMDKLSAMPYIDIIDENDVMLHHRYQLVYACGLQQPLPFLEERAIAIQAVLRSISNLADTGQSVLGKPGVAVWTDASDPSRPPGSFSGLRLLPSKALDEVATKLLSDLAWQLIACPPYEMRWLSKHCNEDSAERLLKCMVDRTVSAEDSMGHAAWTMLDKDQQSQLLALRGLLAGRQLFHCLQKRHLVDYGVSRAADMPAERSEWAQPDVAMLLTTITYYQDGLSLQQLEEALQVMLDMGPNAKHSLYNGWLESCRDSMTPKHVEMLDDVRKLDASNVQQLHVLHQHFSRNMAAVNFWLNFCVLPTETKQYPYRLARSAWHLADNAQGRIVGFSGTNDNHRLLPLQVQQSDPPDASLKATNGKMLQIILSNPKYSTIAPAQIPGSGASKPLWQCLLEKALSEKADALIDCGAILAGVSNRAAAEHILPLLDGSRFQGVCFFEPRASPPTWMVLEARGRCLPRSSAPVAERNTFAIFDDARCRGADLKLRQDAVGMVTLGPGMTKDKLMQAAGRMRLLGRGQKLQFVGTQEVSEKIQRVVSSIDNSTRPSPLTSHHVLQWVMANTCVSMTEGVMEWCKKGLHFVSTKAQAGQPFLQEEQHDLEQLYSHAQTERPVKEQVYQLAEQLLLKPRQIEQGKQPQEHTTQQQQQHHQQQQLQQQQQQQALLQVPGLLSKIRERGAFLGAGHMVITSSIGTDEECERELQKEEEEEEENERQLPRAKPIAETDWDYSAAPAASSAIKLSSHTQLTTLPAAVRKYLPPDSQVQDICWSDRVFLTANFLDTVAMPTVAAGQTASCLSDYLRPLFALLLFPHDGTVCLISEREADALLQLAWKSSSSSSSSGAATHGSLLLQLSYTRLAYYDEEGTQLLVTRLGAIGGKVQRLHETSLNKFLVDLQLFNGDTMYGDGSSSRSKEQQRLLRGMVAHKQSAAEDLVGYRGKLPALPRSHLEFACGDT